jgi:hypothetical protein
MPKMKLNDLRVPATEKWDELSLDPEQKFVSFRQACMKSTADNC